MRATLKIAAATTLAIPLMIGGAPRADAGVLCDTTGICGTIHHVSGPGLAESMSITCAWDAATSGPRSGSIRTLARGKSSPPLCKDTDGFKVPSGRDVVYGYKASYGWVETGRFRSTDWVKIGDSTTYYMWLVRD